MLTVAEFARIQAVSWSLNSGEFSYDKNLLCDLAA